MAITIEQLADLLDGDALREIDEGFDDMMRDEFIDATEHLGTALCDEADAIYPHVERKVKVDYLRDFFKEAA